MDSITSNWTNLLGLGVGISSLMYALYQGTLRRRLEALGRSEAWFLFSKCQYAVSYAQGALERAKQRESGMDTPLLESLVRTEQATVDLLRDSVRLIQRSEPRFDGATIDRWISDKKVSENLRYLFDNLVTESSRR